MTQNHSCVVTSGLDSRGLPQVLAQSTIGCWTNSVQRLHWLMAPPEQMLRVGKSLSRIRFYWSRSQRGFCLRTGMGSSHTQTPEQKESCGLRDANCAVDTSRHKNGVSKILMEQQSPMIVCRHHACAILVLLSSTIDSYSSGRRSRELMYQ